MSAIIEQAPAKVNLTLEVRGRRPDGYHELRSIVAFAGFGDTLELWPDAEPGLEIAGPTAAELAGPNLIAAAMDAVRTAWPAARLGRFRLTKRLPIAGGVGGGSADAAAALRAIRTLNAGRSGAPDWVALARRLGADVPVCLLGRLCVMTGIGETIALLPAIGRLHAVLVNPGVPLATAQVFAALGAPILPVGISWPAADDDAEAIHRRIHSGSNDLQAAAIGLVPAITDVLGALAGCASASAVRLSGSGATCFALFPDAASCQAAAAQIKATQSGWWVEPTTLT